VSRGFDARLPVYRVEVEEERRERNCSLPEARAAVQKRKLLNAIQYISDLDDVKTVLNRIVRLTL